MFQLNAKDRPSAKNKIIKALYKQVFFIAIKNPSAVLVNGYTNECDAPFLWRHTKNFAETVEGVTLSETYSWKSLVSVWRNQQNLKRTHTILGKKFMNQSEADNATLGDKKYRCIEIRVKFLSRVKRNLFIRLSTVQATSCLKNYYPQNFSKTNHKVNNIKTMGKNSKTQGPQSNQNAKEGRDSRASSSASSCSTTETVHKNKRAMLSPTDPLQQVKEAKTKDRSIEELTMNVSALSTEIQMQDVAGYVAHEEIIDYAFEDALLDGELSEEAITRGLIINEKISLLDETMQTGNNNFQEQMEIADMESDNRDNGNKFEEESNQFASSYKGCIPKNFNLRNDAINPRQVKSNLLMKFINEIYYRNEAVNDQAISNMTPKPQRKSNVPAHQQDMRTVSASKTSEPYQRSEYRPINLNQNQLRSIRGQNQQEIIQPARTANVSANVSGQAAPIQRYITGRRTYTIPPGVNDLNFSIRPADYPNSVIDGRAFTTIQATIKRLMTLTGTSERGWSFAGKHGFIMVKCSRPDQSRYIRDNVESIDWELRGIPELVNVSSLDDNILPHIEVRTMDNQATFQEIVAAVESNQIENMQVNCERWRLINQLTTKAGGIVLLILVDRASALTLMQSRYAIQIRLGAFSPLSRLIVPRAIRIMLGEEEGKSSNQEKFLRKLVRVENFLKMVPSTNEYPNRKWALKRKKNFVKWQPDGFSKTGNRNEQEITSQIFIQGLLEGAATIIDLKFEFKMLYRIKNEIGIRKLKFEFKMLHRIKNDIGIRKFLNFGKKKSLSEKLIERKRGINKETVSGYNALERGNKNRIKKHYVTQNEEIKCLYKKYLNCFIIKRKHTYRNKICSNNLIKKGIDTHDLRDNQSQRTLTGCANIEMQGKFIKGNISVNVIKGFSDNFLRNLVKLSESKNSKIKIIKKCVRNDGKRKKMKKSLIILMIKRHDLETKDLKKTNISKISEHLNIIKHMIVTNILCGQMSHHRFGKICETLEKSCRERISKKKSLSRKSYVIYSKQNYAMRNIICMLCFEHITPILCTNKLSKFSKLKPRNIMIKSETEYAGQFRKINKKVRYSFVYKKISICKEHNKSNAGVGNQSSIIKFISNMILKPRISDVKLNKNNDKCKARKAKLSFKVKNRIHKDNG